MNSLYVGDTYTVKPSSIRFDQDMVEFNRMHTEEEYTATKLSIDKGGQNLPICVNDQTGLCEDGRHRVKACLELEIDVKCVLVDGKATKEQRLDLYNIDSMAGRDLNTAQKAIQAHKYAVLTGVSLETAAIQFKTNKRSAVAASSIAGLGKQDILTQIAKDGYWTNPADNKKIRDLRKIATILRKDSEVLEEVSNTTPIIEYTELINTEKGKEEFWRLKTILQMSTEALSIHLVEHLNMKYVLKVNKETGEIDE